jgi:hypothetical protein
MKASDLCTGQEPLQLPERPHPVPQTWTAWQRSDGTVEPGGVGPIRPDEVIEPREWWRTIQLESAQEVLDEAVRPLQTMIPPCPSAARAVHRRLSNLMFLGALDKGANVWLLLHSPAAPLDQLAQTLGRCLFRADDAYLIVDAAVPQNNSDAIFGAPPGYQGCMEGGSVTNQLRIRPESIIVLRNFEVADEGTLQRIRRFALEGTNNLLVSRGCQVCEVSARGAVLILATSRWSSETTKLMGVDEAKFKELLVACLRRARPDLTLNWTDLISHWKREQLLFWNVA